MKSPTTVVGAVVIVLLISMAIFAPLLIEPNTPDPYQMPRDWLHINAPPGSPGHLLGTTPQGGDVLTASSGEPERRSGSRSSSWRSR